MKTLVLVRLRPPPVYDLQVTSVVDDRYEGRVIVAEDGDTITLRTTGSGGVGGPATVTLSPHAAAARAMTRPRVSLRGTEFIHPPKGV